MTHEEAFFQAILDSPDDDAPRLVYADWLEERGDPRGEFIRVQCELARLLEHDPRRPGLEERERSLRRAHEAAWRKTLPALPGIRWFQFERGLMAWVRAVNVNAFLTHAPAVFAAAPVRRVSFDRLAGSRREFMHQVALDTLRAEAVRALVESPYLLRLTGLVLEKTSLGSPEVAVLAASPRVENLTALDLEKNQIDPEGAAALAESPHLAKLAELNLAYNALGTPGAEALAGATRLTGLRRLDLTYNRIGTAGAAALAASPHLGRLDALFVGGNRIGPAGRATLQRRFGQLVKV
jgi:uncharacterized protein (TIGR02996 family)